MAMRGAVAALLIVAGVGLGGTADAKTLKGVSLPDEVQVEGAPLQLNGLGMKRFLFFDLYAVGLYLENPTSEPQEAIQSEQRKRVHVRMLKSVSGDRIASELRKRFERTVPNVEQLRDRIDRLAAAIPDMSNGYDFWITYVPARGTVLRGEDGVEVVIEGKDFADALLQVFLVSGSSDGMQRELFSRD
ncbi:MAG: chalcone isomerase family protein [Myxococcales bacterium]